MRFLNGSMIAEACQKNVEAAIHNFQVKDDTIDLLAISHFDKDHVSGVVKLLRKTRLTP